jgi:Fe-S cluster biogenesis protein NfuA/nitrite reductase/ring-hydroxylating ferredoxin subunit
MQIERVEAQLERVDGLAEPARATALDAVQSIVELYGEGLRRMLAGAREEDDLVSHLLLVHDLHPVSLEQRVEQALDGVRPYLRSHGGDVELLGLEGGVARLRLEGSCNGCGSSRTTMKLAIEDALAKAAPELEGVDAEGVVEEQPSLLQIGGAKRQQAPTWEALDAERQGLVTLQLGEETYAYRDRCPDCGGHVARMGDELRCAGCGHRFDVRRAGRCLDDDRLMLEAVPLLVGGDGSVKVAVTA